MAIIEALIFGWLGAIVLFITTVSPTVFATLNQDQAGQFLRAYFPRLFSIETLIGVALFVTSIYISMEGKLFKLGLGVGLSVIVVSLLNLKWVTPTLNDATDRWIEEKCKRTKRKFILLHTASVGLFAINAICMITLIALSPATAV